MNIGYEYVLGGKYSFGEVVASRKQLGIPMLALPITEWQTEMLLAPVANITYSVLTKLLTVPEWDTTIWCYLGKSRATNFQPVFNLYSGVVNDMVDIRLHTTAPELSLVTPKGV